MYSNDFRTATKSAYRLETDCVKVFKPQRNGEEGMPEPSKDAFSGRKFLEFSAAALVIADASAAGAVPQSRCGSQT
jgi:hypothetical protein